MKQFFSIYHYIASITKMLDDMNAQKLRQKMVNLIFFSLFIILVCALVTFNAEVFGGAEHLGVMGDFFGGMLNPIFGFLSLLALLSTISLQNSEIRASRKAQQEMKLIQEEEVNERINERRTTITLKILSNWQDEEQEKKRNKVFFDLAEYGVDIHKKEMQLIKIKEYDSDMIYHLGVIFDFILDIHSILQKGRMDEELFKLLFKKKLKIWFHIADYVEISHPYKNIDPEQRSRVQEFSRWMQENNEAIIYSQETV